MLSRLILLALQLVVALVRRAHHRALHSGPRRPAALRLRADLCGAGVGRRPGRCARCCARPACRRAPRCRPSLVVALIGAALITWLPGLVPDLGRSMRADPDAGLSADRRGASATTSSASGRPYQRSRKDKGAGVSRAFAAFRDWSDFEDRPSFPRDRPRACLQPQNMPNTTAVRKAKETMAASTLSLILSSILASFAGMSRHSGAELCGAKLGNLRRVRARCQANFDCCSALICSSTW